MNCQEEQMTQEMWDAMPEGMTVNYVSQMEVMNVKPTVSVFNGATHHWDADVGAWYATRITNMDALFRAYSDRVYKGMDVHVATELERVYA